MRILALNARSQFYIGWLANCLLMRHSIVKEYVLFSLKRMVVDGKQSNNLKLKNSIMSALAIKWDALLSDGWNLLLDKGLKPTNVVHYYIEPKELPKNLANGKWAGDILDETSRSESVV